MGNQRIILFQIYYFPGHNDGGALTLPPVSCHSQSEPGQAEEYIQWYATVFITNL